MSQNDVEQIIRPTGLLDPKIDVRPVRGQIDDLEDEIRERVARKERVLVTTLTKRMAEDLTDHLLDAGISVNYMHSDTATMDRVEILRTCARARSTFSWASTCSARAWIFPRCHWWQFSMPIRRASCATAVR